MKKVFKKNEKKWFFYTALECLCIASSEHCCSQRTLTGHSVLDSAVHASALHRYQPKLHPHFVSVIACWHFLDGSGPALFFWIPLLLSLCSYSWTKQRFFILARFPTFLTGDVTLNHVAGLAGWENTGQQGELISQRDFSKVQLRAGALKIALTILL